MLFRSKTLLEQEEFLRGVYIIVISFFLTPTSTFFPSLSRRSEERRVGKKRSSRGAPYHYKDKKVKLEITPQAKKILTERGFDPQWGARPLKRLIQRLILDELAKKLISGRLKEGKKAEVGVKKNEITII